MIRTIKQAIRKMVEAEGGRWDEKIETMETTYRVKKASDVYSDFFLMFGVECRTELVGRSFLTIGVDDGCGAGNVDATPLREVQLFAMEALREDRLTHIK